MGTTAIGVCLVTEEPVQIWGPEHYLEDCHGWTCCSAPVRGPDGQLLAVLHISGYYEKVQTHTLGMIAALGYAVSHELAENSVRNNLLVSNHFLSAVLETVCVGLISVDQNSRLKHINAEAEHLLGISRADINKRLPAEVSRQLGLEQALLSGQSFSSREVSLTIANHRKSLIVSTRPILNNITIVGALAAVCQAGSVRKMINKVVGNTAHYSFDDILGESLSINRTKQLGRFASEVMQNVLILGESGTGKEMFAQAIHNAGSRRHGPFIAVNCAAIPRDLVGSELFGYSEGAFTGARKDGAQGKFELADGGTIFLDEIEGMPLEQQAVFLRVLEERQITRIGGRSPIHIDVRVIAASNKDLLKETKAGRFRHDLFYRLNVLCIRLPALREREGDLELLARHFLAKFNQQFNTRATISKEALDVMHMYHWPGNVRELENTIQQAIFVSGGGVIGPEDLPANILPEADKMQGKGLIKEMEQDCIKNALGICGGNVTEAAKLLGIGRTTLYRKLKKIEKG